MCWIFWNTQSVNIAVSFGQNICCWILCRKADLDAKCGFGLNDLDVKCVFGLNEKLTLMQRICLALMNS